MPIKLPIDRLRGLTNLFRELGYKVGAEIGVSKGYYSKWIVMKTKCEKLYCIDPWLAYDRYVESCIPDGQKVWNERLETAKHRLGRWDGNIVEFVKKTSMDAVNDFMDNSLDFVFIDGNHTFEYVINDIAEWEKKVKPGGIIAGHDYYMSFDTPVISKVNIEYIKRHSSHSRIKLIQVEEAVKAWTKANEIKPWFVTNDRCWLWIKE